MTGEKDTRPYKSPYGGQQAVLHFDQERGQSELRVPFSILEPYEELTRKRKRDKTGTSGGPSCRDFDLTDVPFSVGHVIVHFLLTGTYQTLRFWRLDMEGGRAQEFRTAICVYATAVDKKLPGLRDLARLQIAKSGEQVNILSIFTVIEDGRPVSKSLFGTFHPGIAEYLRFKAQSFVQRATEAEAKDILAKLETPDTIGKILLQNLMLVKLSTEPKLKEDTDPKMDDAPATKSIVQLAEEAILEAEDTPLKAMERHNRLFRETTVGTLEVMEEGYQEQPRAM
ncbi:hypothetical protein NW768_008690 [Fusarium equiseti]|uniref:Uncharacterized protein n=1 Tax=Fusarium equiseti TaxID=61235 RepID=A0ABQ8R570_FUSEQ|nr:hypothetical protein NW768_008690 [Fusarium equiseti]